MWEGLGIPLCLLQCGDYIYEVTDGEGLPLRCAELAVEVAVVYEEVQEGVEQLGRRRGSVLWVWSLRLN